MATTPNGLPYPEPTGKVGAGADDIKALALAVDPLLTPGVAPISRGGTGATTEAAARDNLNVPHDATNGGLKFTSPSFGNLAFQIPGQAYESAIAMQYQIPDTSAFVQKSGDTMSGHLYLPNSSAATSGYTVAYINTDGRVSRGASSRRFKRRIKNAPKDLGNVFPALREYEMIGGDGDRKLGHIAEELADAPALRRFVVFETDDDGNPTGEPLSIDVIQLLQVQVSVLNARLAKLEAGTK